MPHALAVAAAEFVKMRNPSPEDAEHTAMQRGGDRTAFLCIPHLEPSPSNSSTSLMTSLGTTPRGTLS